MNQGPSTDRHASSPRPAIRRAESQEIAVYPGPQGRSPTVVRDSLDQSATLGRPDRGSRSRAGMAKLHGLAMPGIFCSDFMRHFATRPVAAPYTGFESEKPWMGHHPCGQTRQKLSSSGRSAGESVGASWSCFEVSPDQTTDRRSPSARRRSRRLGQLRATTPPRTAAR